MPADWSAIENAIFDWVKIGSGLTEAAIVWAAQAADGNRPSGQHIEIKIGPDVVLGGAPHVRHKYDSGAPLGEEIRHIVDVVRELAVTVTVYGGPTTTGASARSLATKIQNAIALPSVRQALNDAGLAPFDVGRIEHVPAIVDADFEPRAFFRVRMLVADDVEERTGYIAHVEVEDTSTGQIFTVDLE